MGFAHYSTQALASLLSQASDKERAEIARSVGAATQEEDKLAAEISRTGGNGLANAARGHGVGYAEILRDLAETVGLPEQVSAYGGYHIGLSIEEWDTMGTVFRRQVGESDARRFVCEYVRQAEAAVATRLFESLYKGLSEEERIKFNEAVSAQARAKELKTLGGGAATLVALNAGGFATFTAMSSILHLLTAGTLTFSGYTAASSLLATLLGPAGWTALGTLAVYKAASPNKRRLCGAVVQIAVLRAKYEMLNGR